MAADYDVVLITFDVLSKEWAVAKPLTCSVRWYKLNGTAGRGSQSWRYTPDGYKGVAAEAQQRAKPTTEDSTELSELQKVQWQRVVMDEGHSIGGSIISNKALTWASLNARAKWICTGTPAPSTRTAELKHLYGLVSALQIWPYADKKVWDTLIQSPFESQEMIAWIRLHCLLNRTMIRASKADLEKVGLIPACTISTTEFDPSHSEKKTYNALLTIMKRNLVLAEYGDDRVVSLLHPKNRVPAEEAILNFRKACCVTGQFKIEVGREQLKECIGDMRRGHSLYEEGCQCNGSYFHEGSYFRTTPVSATAPISRLKEKLVKTRSGACGLLRDTSRVVPEDRVQHVEQAFAAVNTENGHIRCDNHMRCGNKCLSVFPFITPCGHMICMDCVNLKVNSFYF